MYRIELNSPYIESNKSAIFNINFNGTGNELGEIIKIIRFISEDQQELKDILRENREASKTYENFKKLLEEYNQWIKVHRDDLLKEYRSNDKRASDQLIKYLMVLVYNRSISEPDKLNQYEPFSPEVYGETSFDLIDSLLKRVPLKENETFMDLGSGVGNVVLHVAAASKCKCCYGFEKAEWPSLFAVKMEKEFKFWMNFFGRHYSKFKLYKADFFSDEEFVQRYNPIKDIDAETITMNEYVKDIINEAKLIFVNNYAFGAEVDHQLKLRFCNMLEGSRIVSSKPFCSLNFRINSRNLNDIGTILNINEEEPLNGKVSWTDRPINYYFHKIDRTLLEKYFERLKNPRQDSEYQASSIDGKHRKSTSSLVISTSSGSTQSSAASSPTSSNSSLNSSRSSSKNVKSINRAERNKSTDYSSKSTKRKNKKRKSERSPDSHKATKLMKKESKKLNSATASRSKSLDKDVLNTLAKMHHHVTKPNKESLMKELTLTADAALSQQFNLKSLTTLKNENLDKKLLKDCKISPKLMKTFNKQSESCRSPSESRRSDKLDKHMKKKHSSKQFNGESIKIKNTTLNGLTEEEEALSRQELGVNIMNAVDVYLKKMQKQYVKYLMHLKSSEYEEHIKQELKSETARKNELLARKEKIEKLSSNLLKSNVALLKKRAEELGLKNLQTPHQLIEYARKMLNDNKQLHKKIDIVQKKVNNLNFQHKSVKVNEPIDYENTNSRLQSLDSLLKKIDSKYSNLDIKKGKSSSGVYETAVTSVESTRSADETLSATEKNDDDDQNMAEIDEELKTIDSNILNKPPKQYKRLVHNNKLALSPKIMTPPSVMSPVQNDKYDQLLSGNRGLDEWRSFKIPKQYKPADDVDNSKNIISKSQTPVASPTLSTSSSTSSSTNTNRLADPQTSTQRQISYDSTSSSSSNSINSKNISDVFSTQNTNSNDKNYSSSYYHPKKKQFRQYMMENSNSNQSLDNSSIQNYNTQLNGQANNTNMTNLSYSAISELSSIDPHRNSNSPHLNSYNFKKF